MKHQTIEQILVRLLFAAHSTNYMIVCTACDAAEKVTGLRPDHALPWREWPANLLRQINESVKGD